MFEAKNSKFCRNFDILFFEHDWTSGCIFYGWMSLNVDVTGVSHFSARRISGLDISWFFGIVVSSYFIRAHHSAMVNWLLQAVMGTHDLVFESSIEETFLDRIQFDYYQILYYTPYFVIHDVLSHSDVHLLCNSKILADAFLCQTFNKNWRYRLSINQRCSRASAKVSSTTVQGRPTQSLFLRT